jgi:trehalose 6-phosphate synthase/phosphatase
MVGFHTYSYMRNFSLSLLRILGTEVDVDTVLENGRKVRIGAFPLGIDPEVFSRLAQSARVKREVDHIRAENAGVKILLGVDRLDYIKGIQRRLLALEKLLEDNPDFRGNVRLVQVIVPSRTKVESYERYRRQIDEIVGRINGSYATVNTVPIHHMHRSIPEWQLVALYRAADVMLITSTRDGMNLVAKEFVASRIDEDGVLLLSELVGAAAEMGEAIQINPYDVGGIADAIRSALQMPSDERASRMRALRKQVLSFTVHEWLNHFTRELIEIHSENENRCPIVRVDGRPEELLKKAGEARRLALLLDYDGTLVPFADTPDRATPDPELLDLLAQLSARRNTIVHVVSGRTRDSIERWLGKLPIGLHAEHGFWSRKDPKSEWMPWRDPNVSWKARLLPVLQRFTRNTPGSFIEVKTASLAWHYRLADPEFGPLQARELRVFLSGMFSNVPIETVLGEKVVEIRAAGLHKGVILPSVLEGLEFPYLIIAMGDDRTDEDLFHSLPEGSLPVKIGPGPTCAAYRLPDYHAARNFLYELLQHDQALLTAVQE